jgi:hypothetical protein
MAQVGAPPVAAFQTLKSNSRHDQLLITSLLNWLEVSGVLRSTDGGDTWSDMSAPLIKLANCRTCKAMSAAATAATARACLIRMRLR